MCRFTRWPPANRRCLAAGQSGPAKQPSQLGAMGKPAGPPSGPLDRAAAAPASSSSGCRSAGSAWFPARLRASLSSLECPRRRGALWIGSRRRRLKARVRRRGDDGWRRRARAGCASRGRRSCTSPYRNRYTNYNWCTSCNWCMGCNWRMGCKPRRQPRARPCRPACTWRRAPSDPDMPKDTPADRR